MSPPGGREGPAFSWCGRPRDGPGSDLKVALPILARTTLPGCSPVPEGGEGLREAGGSEEGGGEKLGREGEEGEKEEELCVCCLFFFPIVKAGNISSCLVIITDQLLIKIK